MAPDDIKADVVFRCVGDSMINARIFDGDAVFVRLQPEVENGQIAVVRVDDEYTLKRVYFHEDYVELRLENPVHKAIILRGHQLEPEYFEVVGLAAAFMSVIQYLPATGGEIERRKKHEEAEQITVSLMDYWRSILCIYSSLFFHKKLQRDKCR